jgi:hypothetical protein
MTPPIEGVELAEERHTSGHSPPRHEGTSPSRPLAQFAGEYEHGGYGRARVALEGERLRFSLNAIDEQLEHWHFDTFRVVAGFAAGGLVTFQATADGAVRSLEAMLEPRVRAVVFERCD